MRRALLLCSIFLALGSTAKAADDALFAGTFDPPRQAPGFTLHGSNGGALNLDQFRNKVVVLEFGFTHCRNVCPVTLANLAEAHKKLGPAGSEVQVVFVTVDPERDDAARLHEYLKIFDPSFVGGTGTQAEVKAVEQAYGVMAVKEAAQGAGAMGYDVHHSSSVYLIDRQGRLEALVPFGTSSSDIAHDLQVMLKK